MLPADGVRLFPFLFAESEAGWKRFVDFSTGCQSRWYPTQALSDLRQYAAVVRQSPDSVKITRLMRTRGDRQIQKRLAKIGEQRWWTNLAPVVRVISSDKHRFISSCYGCAE
jgi:hypothetical protein